MLGSRAPLSISLLRIGRCVATKRYKANKVLMQSQTSILLNRANLSSLPNDIRRPAYDVENVQTGIVHIGVGSFHRAHEAMYVDRITPASTNDDIATLKAQGVGNTLLFYALNFID